jgi:antitoxin component YwqK of YwqJK toxin-antitoxin module
MKRNLKINQRNWYGDYHGPWEFHYDNNTLMSKGEFINGKRHGPWEYYSLNKKIFAKGAWKNHKEIGLWYEDKFED